MNAGSRPGGRPQQSAASTTTDSITRTGTGNAGWVPLCLTNGTPRPCLSVAQYQDCLARKQPMCGGHCVVDGSKLAGLIARAADDPTRLAETVEDVHGRIAGLIEALEPLVRIEESLAVIAAALGEHADITYGTGWRR